MGKALLGIILMFAILIAGCAYEYEKAGNIDYFPDISAKNESSLQNKPTPDPANYTYITLTTDDGMELHGKFFEAESSKAVILLHMLGRQHENWDEFAAKLNRAGYNVLAIDLRGHGKSNVDWKEFADEQFTNMAIDVKEAKDFLFLKNSRFRYAIVGASIGANLALNHAVKDKDILGAVLLSPGLDYRGVKTGETVLSYGKRPVLLVASEEDTYSAESTRVLSSKIVGDKKQILFNNAGHGTDMLKAEPELSDEILLWLDEVFE